MNFTPTIGKLLAMVVSACVLLPVPLRAHQRVVGQLPPDTLGADSRDNDVRRIHVTALRGRRQIAYGLAKEDLQFTDSKKPQVVEKFARDDSEPIRLVVLVDVSLSENEALQPTFGPLLAPFLKNLVLKRDQAMVAVFAEEPLALTEFTNDLGRLESAARTAFAATPQGPGNLFDAIDWACRERLAHTAGLRVLVIVSNAFDTNSVHNFDEVRDTLARTDTLVYVVQPYLLGGGFGRVDVANWLANETGGFAYGAYDDRGFRRDLERIALVVSNLYTLAYVPRGVVHDGKFHEIRLRSKRRGVNLYTREGYFAPPE